MTIGGEDHLKSIPSMLYRRNVKRRKYCERPDLPSLTGAAAHAPSLCALVPPFRPASDHPGWSLPRLLGWSLPRLPGWSLPAAPAGMVPPCRTCRDGPSLPHLPGWSLPAAPAGMAPPCRACRDGPSLPHLPGWSLPRRATRRPWYAAWAVCIERGIRGGELAHWGRWDDRSPCLSHRCAGAVTVPPPPSSPNRHRHRRGWDGWIPWSADTRLAPPLHQPMINLTNLLPHGCFSVPLHPLPCIPPHRSRRFDPARHRWSGRHVSLPSGNIPIPGRWLDRLRRPAMPVVTLVISCLRVAAVLWESGQTSDRHHTSHVITEEARAVRSTHVPLRSGPPRPQAEPCNCAIQLRSGRPCLWPGQEGRYWGAWTPWTVQRKHVWLITGWCNRACARTAQLVSSVFCKPCYYLSKYFFFWGGGGLWAHDNFDQHHSDCIWGALLTAVVTNHCAQPHVTGVSREGIAVIRRRHVAVLVRDRRDLIYVGHSETRRRSPYEGHWLAWSAVSAARGIPWRMDGSLWDTVGQRTVKGVPLTRTKVNEVLVGLMTPRPIYPVCLPTPINMHFLGQKHPKLLRLS